MKVCILYISIAALALCLMGTAADAAQLVYDDFNANSVGTNIVPTGWTQAQAPPAGQPFCTIYEDTPPDRYVGLYDKNDTTGNNALMKTYGPVTQTSGGGTGVLVAQADIAFGQNTAAFHMNLSSATPTQAGNCLVRVVFEGNVKWATDGGAGKISYLAGSTTPYVTFKDADGLTPLTYSTYTWYTLRIEANLNTGKYHVFFGPQGSPVDIDMIANPTDPGLAFANAKTQANYIGFNSSIKKTGTPAETAGDMYIDNVSVTGDVTVTSCATIAEAKNTPKGTIVQLTDKIVTAGTDQLAGAFFYIQDDTGGMRVRPFPSVVVHQGDKVTVSGSLDRGSEGGSYMKRVGEKEIAGLTQVTVTAGPFLLPKPVAMINKSVGGGNFGPMDPDFVAQPGAYLGDGNMADPATTRLQVPDIGLSNIGRYVKVFGKVLYSDRQRGHSGGFFYIDDGCGVKDGSHFPWWIADGSVPAFPTQIGVRVHCKNSTTRYTDIEGKYAVITGIVGAIGASDAVIKTGNALWTYCNVRVVRPVEETFTDTNANGVWDAAEPLLIDLNSNGVWDPGDTFADTLRKNGLWDTGEPFVDTNNTMNTVWDAAEIYEDTDLDGVYDLGETFTDANTNGVWDAAETYVDDNLNGVYDLGEPFTDTANQKNAAYDLGEPFTDQANVLNGVWDPAEPFLDSNGNGVWDGMIFLP